MWLSVPLRSIARVGEHIDAVWKFVMRSPEEARRSRLGVWISLPKQPTSDQPRSSATMMRKFGFLDILIEFARWSGSEGPDLCRKMIKDSRFRSLGLGEI